MHEFLQRPVYCSNLIPAIPKEGNPQNVLIVFTEFLNVPPVIFLLSTRSFSANMNFKMELKAQLGSCLPLSANKLHLLSNVDPSSDMASKNRLSLLKYDSLVCGYLIEYSNIVYGSVPVSFCSSSCVNYYLSYLSSPIRELLEVRVRWDSDPRHFNPIKDWLRARRSTWLSYEPTKVLFLVCVI